MLKKKVIILMNPTIDTEVYEDSVRKTLKQLFSNNILVTYFSNYGEKESDKNIHLIEECVRNIETKNPIANIFINSQDSSRYTIREQMSFSIVDFSREGNELRSKLIKQMDESCAMIIIGNNRKDKDGTEMGHYLDYWKRYKEDFPIFIITNPGGSSLDLFSSRYPQNNKDIFYYEIESLPLMMAQIRDIYSKRNMKGTMIQDQYNKVYKCLDALKIDVRNFRIKDFQDNIAHMLDYINANFFEEDSEYLNDIKWLVHSHDEIVRYTIEYLEQYKKIESAIQKYYRDIDLERVDDKDSEDYDSGEYDTED